MCKGFLVRTGKTSIASLAQRLNLSTCTVSKILTRSFKGCTYAPETIRRVESMARQQGYRPNLHARSLRTRKSQLIGLILPTAQLHFFGALTESIEVALRSAQYQILVTHSRENPATETEMVRFLLDRGVDGLLWAPVARKVRLDSLGLNDTFPLVLLDSPGCSSKIPLVATDNRAAARDLALRLKQLGHRTMAILSTTEADRSILERLQGIQEVFPSRLHVINTKNEIAAARQAVQVLAKGPRTVTALITLSQTLSFGAISGLRDLGWDIPARISFAGFDDFPLASHWNPPLTVIRQDIGAIARKATDLLLARIQNPTRSSIVERIPPILEWRQSVARVEK